MKTIIFLICLSFCDCSLLKCNGSVYNGSCIYISNEFQKLTWFKSKSFCSKLIPSSSFNSSLLKIDNHHQLQFLTEKLKNKSQSNVDLVFFIGLQYNPEIKAWKWENNHTINDSLLNKSFISHNYGNCASLAFISNKRDWVIRSVPCYSTMNRFICEYSNFLKFKISKRELLFGLFFF
jgi:hypothetical protein